MMRFVVLSLVTLVLAPIHVGHAQKPKIEVMIVYSWADEPSSQEDDAISECLSQRVDDSVQLLTSPDSFGLLADWVGRYALTIKGERIGDHAALSAILSNVMRLGAVRFVQVDNDLTITEWNEDGRQELCERLVSLVARGIQQFEDTLDH